MPKAKQAAIQKPKLHGDPIREAIETLSGEGREVTTAAILWLSHSKGRADLGTSDIYASWIGFRNWKKVIRNFAMKSPCSRDKNPVRISNPAFWKRTGPRRGKLANVPVRPSGQKRPNSPFTTSSNYTPTTCPLAPRSSATSRTWSRNSSSRTKPPSGK